MGAVPAESAAEIGSVAFCAMARLLADEAKRIGLRAPGFRCPPRTTGLVRAIRRYPDGASVVAVQIRERAAADVVADMVEGIVVANRLPPRKAAHVRAQLLELTGTRADHATAA
jgi:hypothetical protein